MDHDVRDPRADAHDGLGRGLEVLDQARPAEGPHEGEGDDVDQRGRQPPALDGSQQRPDHVALGGHQQDANHVALGPGQLLHDLKVEDGFLDGDGDEVLRLELQRRPHVLGAHLRQVSLADDDPLVADAYDHGATPEARLPPQAADGRCHRRGVEHLARLHGAGRQPHLAETGERDLLAAEHQLHGPHGARTHVQPHGALGHQRVTSRSR